MKARFAGKCFGGEHPVAIGDEVVRDRIGWSHPGCVNVSTGASLARSLAKPVRPVTAAETEWAREDRLFREAVARLTPAEKRGWDGVMVDHEFFDGESGIALGVLERMKRDRTLVGYRPRYGEF